MIVKYRKCYMTHTLYSYFYAKSNFNILSFNYPLKLIIIYLVIFKKKTFININIINVKIITFFLF